MSEQQKPTFFMFVNLKSLSPEALDELRKIITYREEVLNDPPDEGFDLDTEIEKFLGDELNQ